METILASKVTPPPPPETGETGEINKNLMKKRNRKHSAQSLPKGLEHHMMKKYVVYYREFVNLKNGKQINTAAGAITQMFLKFSQ